MLLNELLQAKYPGIDLLHAVVLQDDGQGPYIKEWNLVDTIKPSQQDLDDWGKDPEIIAEYTRVQNMIKNQPIYDELDEIDKKSIRAIRSQDNAQIQYWEQKAVDARGKLIK